MSQRYYEECDDEEIRFDDVTIKAMTERAFLLVRDQDEEGEWFPRSQLDWVEPDGEIMKGVVTTFYIPAWLAREKGWG